jgi:ATP-dependent NAD(P)H-hydrate dehydratase
MPVIAAVGGSTLTRAAAHLAFAKQGRGLVTSDILSYIGPAYEKCIGSEGEKGWKGKF